MTHYVAVLGSAASVFAQNAGCVRVVHHDQCIVFLGKLANPIKLRYRTVHRDGQVYLEDEFSTHYMPWRAVYEYGPGTKIPKDKKNNND